ncbi:MAG TPA: diaminopimelate epimerase [Chitinophagaceae bacterium]|nr:diaminopimelate epimerase [Chitinophagaceae bacterium]
MEIKFHKYQGTGNDFIILDNRKGEYAALSASDVKKLCKRNFGIGADGLMLFNEKEGYDFDMTYYNADGRVGSLCGNGSRCMIKFAFNIGIIKVHFLFTAADGVHEAKLSANGIVSLKMNNVESIQKHHLDYILDTGSPHLVKLTPDVMKLDVNKAGKEIRYSKEFEKEGINVNFVEQLTEPDKLIVRTYERGVENETLSCGTGVTAAALVCFHNESGFNEVEIKTPGGMLNVEFNRTNKGSFKNIWLCGPAEKVFEGVITL